VRSTRENDRRAGALQPVTDPDRSQNEGERAPKPDPAVVQAAAFRLAERESFAERQDRRPGGAGEQAEQQQRPEVPRETEQDEPAERDGGQQNHRTAPLPEPIRGGRDQQVGDDPRPERRRKYVADLGRAKPARLEPHRPERQVDADRGEIGGIEQREARGEQALPPRHVGGCWATRQTPRSGPHDGRRHATLKRCTASGSSSMPSPGRSGTWMWPATGRSGCASRWSRSGFSPTSYSTMRG
jgi:hypothetical protein